MMIDRPFKPAWWLRGPHAQTLWASLAPRPIRTPITRERLILPDGDFLDLDWANRHAQGPIIVLLHGLEGSVGSSYIKGMLQALVQHGFRAVLMHFRSCSEEDNQRLQTYHLGYTDDLAYLVQHLQQREPQTPLGAIGYSLGGNVLLKWLGETQASNPLQCAVAVSVPFSFGQRMHTTFTGFSTLYERHLVRLLTQKALKRSNRFTYPVTPQHMQSMKTFFDFDQHITAPVNGFTSAKDYYQKNCARQFLKDIQVPTLIIQANDDPFAPADVIPRAEELSESVRLEVSQGGGHVGFVCGNVPGVGHYWLEETVPEVIKANMGKKAP